MWWQDLLFGYWNGVTAWLAIQLSEAVVGQLFGAGAVPEWLVYGLMEDAFVFLPLAFVFLPLALVGAVARDLA
ncbi:MAG TPA: hypothetical protein VFN74_03845 [Chloroflexota bacterium]|nr:hypothetical protein [Chloroflexota bacterium]